jgi:hypothetical protein
LSDQQCSQIEAYVRAGGSLLSEFETGLYDQHGRSRQDFGLSSLFGIQKLGERAGSRGFQNSFYARIEQPGHELMRGFSGTQWTAGAEWRVPVKAATAPVMTVVPPYPAYPTEVVYTETMRTGETAVTALERENSRLVYLAGDVGRTFWRSGHPDALRLILNSIDWLLRARRPVEVQGEGLMETFAWETEAGFALHLLNLNNPNLHRGVMLRHYPLGRQTVRLQLPRDLKIKRLTALRAEKTLPFRQTGRLVEFTVPGVLDYEVAALE